MTCTHCNGGCSNGVGEKCGRAQLVVEVTPRHIVASSGLLSYGGDAQIVATRGEIDRVIAELNGLEGWLRAQVELQDFAVEPVLRVRLALELPLILEKLSRIRDACGHAADSYFAGEVEISRELREGTISPLPAISSSIAAVGSMFGVLGETKVSADLVGVASSITAPNSIGTLAERLLSESQAGVVTSDDQPGWLRIEKFLEPASPVNGATGSMVIPEACYVVYIPGTQNWAPKPGTNPFDMTSNLSAFSKTGFAGSERAVLAAMQQAGISADSQVLLVGHSQGGMIAANISTRFAGSKVLTFGAPLGQVSDRIIAPTLSIEHSDDPVPKLDSRPNPMKSNWVTVRQSLPSPDPIAQHEMAGYLQTALDVDSQAADSGLGKLRKEISEFSGTPEATGQAYFFELRREP